MAMKSGGRLARRPRDAATGGQGPIRPRLFWLLAGLTLIYLGIIFYLAIASVPLESWGIPGLSGEASGWLPRIFLIGLAMLFLVSALAVSEIIPPRGAWTWAHLRRSKVLSQIAFQMLSAAGFIVGISNVFNPPADQKTASAILADTRAISATTTNTSEKLTELDRWLRTKFPDDPAILNQIAGRWGDLEPACEVIWNISVIRRGQDAALVAETVKTPAGVQAWRFVGSITRADGDTIHVEGVEPDAALGSAAHFTFNAATQRLTWDDRARGSGGVEVYKRCD